MKTIRPRRAFVPKERILKSSHVPGRHLLRYWWFAVVLAVALVATAVAATPYGHSVVDSAVSAAGGYYFYLSTVFKS